MPGNVERSYSGDYEYVKRWVFAGDSSGPIPTRYWPSTKGGDWAMNQSADSRMGHLMAASEKG